VLLANFDKADAAGVMIRLVFDSRGLFRIGRVSDADSVLGSKKSPHCLHMQIKCLGLEDNEALVHFKACTTFSEWWRFAYLTW
jgi:hypothetical protein